MTTFGATAIHVHERDIDMSLGTITTGTGSSTVLRPQTLAVLDVFLKHPDILVSKNDLLAAVWPGLAVTDDSLVKCITELRKALGDVDHSIIKTISKRGYVFHSGEKPVAAPYFGWLGSAVGLGMIALLALIFLWPLNKAPVMREPTVAVLPFANLSGDLAEDYLGAGIAEDVITMLSSYPAVRVVSRTASIVYDKPVSVQQVRKDLNVNYVIEGSVRRAGSKVRVTAQLIDAVTGQHLWANRFDEESGDAVTLQENIANKIYDTLAGQRGEFTNIQYTKAWSKSAPSLEEYDYYMRGHQVYFRFTKDDNVKARKIFQEGLTKFPDSVLLRTGIVVTYKRDILYEQTEEPWRDVELAWNLSKEAEVIPDKSRLESLMSHLAMAHMYYLHEGDFERSADEAILAAKLVPNDAFTRAGLAQFLVISGRNDLAIEWMEEAARRYHPSGRSFYFGDLAFAYYNAGRPADAVAQFQKIKQPLIKSRKLNLAAAYVRAGKLLEAQVLVAEVLRDYPGWTLKKEAVWPTGKRPRYAEPILRPYLADLAKAGLPGG